MALSFSGSAALCSSGAKTVRFDAIDGERVLMFAIEWETLCDLEGLSGANEVAMLSAFARHRTAIHEAVKSLYETGFVPDHLKVHLLPDMPR